MTKTFRDALMHWKDVTGRSLRDIASSSGVSYEQLKKLGQGKSRSTNVDDAVRIANDLGMTLEEFLDDKTVLIRSEIVEIYNKLSEQERQFLLASARGVSSDHREGNQKSPEEPRED